MNDRKTTLIKLAAGLVLGAAAAGTAAAQAVPPPDPKAAPSAAPTPLPQPHAAQPPPAKTNGPVPGTVNGNGNGKPAANCGPANGCGPAGSSLTARFRAKSAHIHNWLQAHMLGYPKEWEAQPLGAATYAAYRIHVSEGDAARMVLHHYDFEEGGDKLKQRGMDQLIKMTGMLPA